MILLLDLLARPSSVLDLINRMLISRSDKISYDWFNISIYDISFPSNTLFEIGFSRGVE